MTVDRFLCDVTGTVNVSDPDAVASAVCSMMRAHHPDFNEHPIRQGFKDMQVICAGHHPDLLACDMPYHNLSHFLDTTLLMARLLDGYERAHQAIKPLGATQCSVAILLALFHDVGLFRHRNESHLHGVQLLTTHEQRGVDWMRNYLTNGAFASHAGQAELIFATALNRPITETLKHLPTEQLTVAHMLGTADLMSQLSGRYYLENCRDLLYQEMQLAQAGAMAAAPDGSPTLYTDTFDLLRKTPVFYAQVVAPRLEQDFAQVYRYAALHFGGDNPYERGMQRNLNYLQQLIKHNDLSALRRQPIFIKKKPN